MAVDDPNTLAHADKPLPLVWQDGFNERKFWREMVERRLSQGLSMNAAIADADTWIRAMRVRTPQKAED